MSALAPGTPPPTPPSADRKRLRVGVDLRAAVGAPTGAGVYVLSLLRALARRAAADYLALAHRVPAAAADLRRLGVRVETQPAPLGVLWQQLVLPRRLGRGDLELFWSPLMTLPWRLPVPAVVTVHDLTPILYPETHRLKVRLSVLPFLHKTLEQARRIVVDSQATARDLRFHFPACGPRVRVIYPGVDAEFQPADADTIAAIRAELDCPDGYLLAAGTLEPRKNLRLLFEVWHELRREDPLTPPLVVTGPYGWGCRSLLRRIEELRPHGLLYLGRVPRERLVRLFQAARLFIYPSLYEGFGLPPAEAMACGVATVASNRSSLPEIVGDAGLTIDPTDGHGLKLAIARLLGDRGLASDLGQRALERMRRFRWSRAAEEMEEVFRECRTVE